MIPKLRVPKPKAVKQDDRAQWLLFDQEGRGSSWYFDEISANQALKYLSGSLYRRGLKSPGPWVEYLIRDLFGWTKRPSPEKPKTK